MYRVAIDHQLMRCLSVQEINDLQNVYWDTWEKTKTFRTLSGEVFFKIGNGTLAYGLDLELHQWLSDRNIDYHVGLDMGERFHPTRIWLVGFEDPRDAMMFKLTWGGE